MFTERDLTSDYDSDEATAITLSGDSVTITEEGVYVISGSISDGQIIVDADDSAKIQLVLDGVSINCDSSAAIYVKNADKVFITLEDGTENTLSVSGDYVAIDDNNIDGAIFAKCDLTFNGTGALTINAEYGNGIVGKDDVAFTSGEYSITAANHGISANDSVRIVDSTFDIVSGKDGIQGENDEDGDLGFIYIESGVFNIDATADGIATSSYMLIEDGEFNISSGGGFVEVLNSITVGEGSGSTTFVTDTLEYSMKALKSAYMTINGGTFNLSSYEDTIHANGDFTINGGTFTLYSGDDAVHADYLLTINDGTIDIQEAYEGIEGDDITINGGDISVNVLDDGINVGSSSGLLSINGGDIYVFCNGDALDSNGSFEMTGGYVVLEVEAYYTGGDSEVDVSGDISFTGGTIVDEDGNEIDPTSSSTSMTMPGFSNQMTFGRR